MHIDVNVMNEVRVELREWFQNVIARSTHVPDKVNSPEGEGGYDDVTLCDLGWCYREIENMADELRKEAKAKKSLIGKVLAQRRAQASINMDSDDQLKVRGELATAVPDVKHEPILPKKGSPDYEALCRWAGIEPDLSASGVVSFHYVRLGEHLTAMAARGENPPAELEAKPVWNCTFITKRQVAKDKEES